MDKQETLMDKSLQLTVSAYDNMSMNSFGMLRHNNKQFHFCSSENHQIQTHNKCKRFQLQRFRFLRLNGSLDVAFALLLLNGCDSQGVLGINVSISMMVCTMAWN